MPSTNAPGMCGKLPLLAAVGLIGTTTLTSAAVADPPQDRPLQESLDSLVKQEKFPAALAWTSRDGRHTSLVSGSSLHRAQRA